MIYFKLFFTFLKIGAFTFGGGYAMIPLIQVEVVDKNHWLNNEEFLDTIGISQSAPGAIAVNSSIFIGYRIGGLLGSILCTLGVVLPSFGIILFISMFLYQYRDNKIVERIFMGIRPAVVGLIASAVYKLTKTSGIKGWIMMIPFLVVVAIILGVNPIFMILLSGLGTVIYSKLAEIIHKIK